MKIWEALQADSEASAKTKNHHNYSSNKLLITTNCKDKDKSKI